MSRAMKKNGFRSVLATIVIVLGTMSTFTMTASPASAAMIAHDPATAVMTKAQASCCVNHISPAMWEARLEQTKKHVYSVSLLNKKLHVRTTVVGWRRVYVRVHGHRTEAYRTRFRSVHVDSAGHAYGMRVYFTQTPKGPVNVVYSSPPVAARAMFSWNGGGSWNPLNWHWKSIAHFAYEHVAKSCGKGIVDGYLAFNNTVLVSKMLAAGGVVGEGTAIAAAGPDIMAVGVVSGCSWGVYKSF